LEGKIKKLIRGRGFGFISSGGKDIFFHCSALQGISFDTLKEGDRVKFDLERGDRGPQAVNVSLIRG
jgi:CspA family cold shock protein